MKTITVTLGYFNTLLQSKFTLSGLKGEGFDSVIEGTAKSHEVLKAVQEEKEAHEDADTGYFSWALRQLREGKKARRMAWSTGSYISVSGDLIREGGPDADYPRWRPEYVDMTAEDWVLVE